MKYNLSEITELIRDRRTIYPEQYSARKVQREQVELLLRNAIWAPNHGMTQPWRFKVYLDEQVTELAKFQAELYKRITPPEDFKQHKYDKLVSRGEVTSALVVVCMQRQESGKIREIEEYAAVACGIQNMQLTATAYGFGAFWSTGGVTYKDEYKEYLKLGADDRVVGQIHLGYADAEWPTSHRKPLEYVTEWFE